MTMPDYFFKIIKFCHHGALFLWQHHHFVNIRCFSNVVAMTTFIWLLHKVSAHLKDKICYYEPCLKTMGKWWFFTLLKCVIPNILQNLVSRGPFLCSFPFKCQTSPTVWTNLLCIDATLSMTHSSEKNCEVLSTNLFCLCWGFTALSTAKVM